MVGRIIKSGEPGAPITSEPNSVPRMPAPAPRKVLDSEVVTAHGEAKQIIARAEAQAAQIIARAQQERDQVLAEGHEEGRQKGYAEMTEILARARIAHGQLIKDAEPQLVKLAIKIAERVIGAELQLGDEALLAIVAKAVDQLRQSKELVLRINPTDAEILRREKRKLLEYIGRLKDIGFKEDPHVARGGCVIETENGTVDAQLSTQLELLEHTLLGEEH
jgi:type III secretion protein L